MDGNGFVDVYGNLLVEFYPDNGLTIALSQNFSKPDLDLSDGTVKTLASISIDPPEDGTVIVDLDGDMTSLPEDWFTFAASNFPGWQVDDGNITVHAFDDDLNRNILSHSRAYRVHAEHNVFYAVVQRTSPGATGIATINGQLSVRYFPDQMTGTHEVGLEVNDFDVAPNPAMSQVQVTFHGDFGSHQLIEMLDVNGRMLSSYRRMDATALTIDLSSYPRGMYLLKSGEVVKKVMKI